MKKYLSSLFLCLFVLLLIGSFKSPLRAEQSNHLLATLAAAPSETAYTLVDDDVVVENGVIMSCSYNFIQTDIIIPDELDGQIITGIGRDVFASKVITSVDLSKCNSLKTIESYAFSNNNITSVQFPVSIETIGQFAFTQNGLTSIDFSNCPVLQVIDADSFSQNNIDNTNFSGCIALQRIGDEAFFYNKLTVLDLSGCTVLQEINSFAFKNNNLISVQLPASLQKIGKEAFYVNQIESVNFSNLKGLQSIGDQAFSGNRLASIDLSNYTSLQSIGNSAFESNNITFVSFSGCTTLESLGGFYGNSITSVDLSGLTALQSISQDAFGQNNIENVDFSGCTALKIIEDRAFRGNRLELVDLSSSKSLETIMYSVFENNLVGCGVVLPIPDIPGYKFNNWKASNGNEYAGGATVYDFASIYYHADLMKLVAVNFTVSDGSNPIAEAIIKLGNYNIEITDDSGSGFFGDVPDGTYVYTVTATGYETVSSSVTVSGADVSLDVEMTSAIDPSARILLAENSRFEVWGVTADADAADTVLSVLTQNYGRIAATLNTQIAVITVDIYPDLDSYHEAIGNPNAADWAVGSAWGESNIRMVSPFNPGSVHSFSSILEVVVHEMVHCFVAHVANYSIPIWINEGTATYYAYQGPPSKEVLENYINNLGHKPTLDELNNGSTFGDIGGYNFSYTIAEFIVEHLGGADMLVDFLASNEGYSILGYNSKLEFQTAWYNYLDEHYLGITNSYSITIAVTDGQNPIEGAEVIFTGYEGEPIYTDVTGKATKSGFSNGSAVEYYVFAQGFVGFFGAVSTNGSNVEETVQLVQESNILFSVQPINNCDCKSATAAKVTIESGTGSEYRLIYERKEDGVTTDIDTSETFTSEITINGLQFDSNAEVDVYYEFVVVDSSGSASESMIVEDVVLIADVWQTGTSTVSVIFLGENAPYTIYQDEVAVESDALPDRKYSFSVAPGEHIFSVTDSCGCSVSKSIVIAGSDESHTLTCDDVTIQNGVITACSYDFSKTDIVIPDTLCGQAVIGIGYRLFRFKYAITSVQFPATLEFIEDEAFVGNQITNADFSRCSNLHTIGNLAFLTNNISNLDLPSGLTSLGGGVFNGNHIETLNGNAFDGFFYALNPDGTKDETTLLSYAKETASVAIPVQVETLFSHALNSTGITSVDISQCENLRKIGYRAFFNNQIPSVDLSACTNLERIEASGFLYAGLNSIDLSSCLHLNYIGIDAFSSNSLSGFVLPTPQKDGFEFTNWTDGNSKEYAGGETVSDLTLAYTANFAIDANYLPLSCEVEVTDASCVNSADGKIVITISGGLGGSYNENGQNSGALSDGNAYHVNVKYLDGVPLIGTSLADTANVCVVGYGFFANNYLVEVIDARGSSATAMVTVSSPAPLDFEMLIQSDITCNGSSDGAFSINAGGGTSPYQYAYSEVAGEIPANFFNEDLFELPAGTYFGWVKDANGCIAGGDFNSQHRIVVSEPSPIVAIPNVEVLCDKAVVEIATMGGTAPYQYRLSASNGGEIISNLDVNIWNVATGAEYFLEVTDAMGCITIDTIKVEEKELVAFTVEMVDVCYGSEFASAKVVLTNGDPDASFKIVYAKFENGNMMKADTSEFFSKDVVVSDLTFNSKELVDVSYQFSVLSEDGCSTEDKTMIFEQVEAPLSVNILESEQMDEKTDFEISATGGTSPYSILLNGATIASNANKATVTLAAGTHIIEVLDSRNCYVSDTLAVEGAATEEVEFVVTDGVNPLSGAVVALSNHGSVASNNQGRVVFTNISDGTYSYTVTADNYEVFTGSITVSGSRIVQEITLEETVPETYTVEFIVTDGDNLVSGAVVALSDHGSVASNNQGRVVFTNISDGTYSYTVTADNYEVFTGSITVSGSRIVQEITLEETVPETYTVEFIVADGVNPLSGAVVALSDHGSVASNNQGRVVFTNISDGIYSYTVTADNYEVFTGSITVSGSGIMQEITLEETVSETYTVEFIVTDGDNPVSGAVVTLDGTLSVITGSNGQAVFDEVTNGTYSYTISADDYVELSDVIVVAGSNLTQQVNLTFEGYTVQFLVFDGVNPILGAAVELLGYPVVETNINGVAEVEGVSDAAELYYSVKAEGYNNLWNIVSVQGRDLTEQVELVAAHSVLFTVIDETSIPVVGAAVELEGYGTVVSDISGHCNFSGVIGSESLNYEVSAIGFNVESGIISVNNEDVVKEIVISESQAETYSVTFSIVNSSGPVSGANVSISNYGTVETDGNGRAVFSDVFSDSLLTYSVSASGYDLHVGYTQVKDEAISVLVNMTPVQIEKYSVSFVISDGENPIEGASVSFGKYGSFSSDSSGKVTFEKISPSEKIAYSIFASNYYLESGTVKVEENDVVQEIVLSGTVHSVQFRVLSDGTAVSGVNVLLGDYGTVITNSEGMAIFENVYDESQIEYCVYSPGYKLEIGAVSVAHSDVEKTLSLMVISKSAFISEYKVNFSVVNGEDPIENATVYFDTYGFKNTDSEGTVSFNNIKPADEIGYCVKIDGYGLVIGEAKIVDLDESIVIDIFKETYDVEFVVREDGEPISDALVNLQGFGSKKTNPQGKVMFSNVESGSSLAYSVSRINYDLEYGNNIAVEGADVSRTINLHANRTSLVRFVIKSGESLVPRASVSLSGYGTKTTNNDGVVQFDGVLPGAVIGYSVLAQNYKLLSGTVNVEKTDIEKQIDLLASTFQATFNVNSDDECLVGAAVTLEGFGTQLTDEKGKVTFRNIPSGTALNYVVVASAYEDLTGKVVLGASDIVKSLEVNFVGCRVTFKIVNSSGEAVNGAKVLFNGEILITNDSGEVTYTGVDIDESVEYTVELSGYYVFSKTIRVDSEDVTETAILLATAVAEMDAQKIEMYPNPVQSVITIENVADCQIDIYNLSGKLMKQIGRASAIEKIDVSSFTTGIYIVKINGCIKKLVVNKI